MNRLFIKLGLGIVFVMISTTAGLALYVKYNEEVEYRERWQRFIEGTHTNGDVETLFKDRDEAIKELGKIFAKLDDEKFYTVSVRLQSLGKENKSTPKIIDVSKKAWVRFNMIEFEKTGKQKPILEAMKYYPEGDIPARLDRIYRTNKYGKTRARAAGCMAWKLPSKAAFKMILKSFKDLSLETGEWKNPEDQVEWKREPTWSIEVCIGKNKFEYMFNVYLIVARTLNSKKMYEKVGGEYYDELKNLFLKSSKEEVCLAAAVLMINQIEKEKLVEFFMEVYPEISHPWALDIVTYYLSEVHGRDNELRAMLDKRIEEESKKKDNRVNRETYTFLEYLERQKLMLSSKNEMISYTKRKKKLPGKGAEYLEERLKAVIARPQTILCLDNGAVAWGDVVTDKGSYLVFIPTEFPDSRVTLDKRTHYRIFPKGGERNIRVTIKYKS